VAVEGWALAPMQVLFPPVVRLDPANEPTAVLNEPVDVLTKARLPKAELLLAVQ
jgi:hypothetical protein